MIVSRSSRIVAVAFGTFAAYQSQPEAATLNATMPASLTIVDTCSAFSAGSMAFGTAASSGQVNAETIVSVTCTGGAPYNIYSSGGLNDTCTAGVVYDYHMSNAQGQVPYRIFTNPERTTELAHQGLGGCGSQAPDLTGVGTGSSQGYVLYGAAYPTGAASGTYNDTVTLTVFF